MRDIFDLEQHLRGMGRADRTVNEYVKWARRLWRWCQIEGEDMATLPAHRLRDWIDSTVPPGRESRKQAHTACKHLYLMLGRADEPWLAIRTPRKRQGRPNPLPADDASALLKAAWMHGGREGTATIGLMFTAARPGEVAAWRWDGIDYDHETIRWWRPKVSDHHHVHLHPILAVTLERFAGPWSEGFVFPGRDGRAYVKTSTIWEWVRKVAEVAGVADVTPRRLRHTVGSKVANATGDIQAAARMMGNSVEVASRYYTAVDEERAKAASKALRW